MLLAVSLIVSASVEFPDAVAFAGVAVEFAGVAVEFAGAAVVFAAGVAVVFAAGVAVVFVSVVFVELVTGAFSAVVFLGACLFFLSLLVLLIARLRKVRHMRGHVSMGHGRVGRHRKHGGGRGNAGGMQHMRILFCKNHPGYFGKKGQRHFHLNRNQ